jgi:hypothetical protein
VILSETNGDIGGMNTAYRDAQRITGSYMCDEENATGDQGDGRRTDAVRSESAQFRFEALVANCGTNRTYHEEVPVL